MVTRRGEKQKSLTCSYDCSSAGSSLCAASAQGQNKAQPAETDLFPAAIEVGRQRAGSLECANLAIIGRVADREHGFDPAGAGGDGTTMHEDIEAGAAAVGAVATLTDTAEWKGWDVQCSVVDGSTT